ncbi:carbamoyl-phosphate synthase L chain, ATP binding domain-containing protein [Aspergillus falconensis]
MTSIGPSDTALSTLDDKRAAKDYLRRHAPDIPLIPGYAGSSQDAAKLGKEPGQLYTELERVQPEAQRWIGSADFILERYVESSKHVEIQILGDVHDEVVSFFERDCSVQRRHQKVLEETPCAFLTDRTRQQMSATAVRIANLNAYENAGTVEFVVDAVIGKFCFLEPNVRL